ncbi:transcriptional regulator ATRX homolog [Paramacrobiotus metropolitanus]|uniref:transcriptional regulator ATRX homolog n=1 Tax=Paramacrobiotus metropolitanus TaxID=2943436 RepID=UPI002445CDE5|nr:transcriptional regulator ATRX homolog [Paramacrobiotus metropolitanus]
MPHIPTERFPKAQGPVAKAADPVAIQRTDLLNKELKRVREDEMERTGFQPTENDDKRVKWLNRKLKETERVCRTKTLSADTEKTVKKLVQEPRVLSGSTRERATAKKTIPQPSTSNGFPRPKIRGGEASGDDAVQEVPVPAKVKTTLDGPSSSGSSTSSGVKPGAAATSLKDTTNKSRPPAIVKIAASKMQLTSTPKRARLETTDLPSLTVSPIKDFSLDGAQGNDSTGFSASSRDLNNTLVLGTSLQRVMDGTVGRRSSEQIAVEGPSRDRATGTVKTPSENDAAKSSTIEPIVKQELNRSILNVSSASQVVVLEMAMDVDIHDVSLNSVGAVVESDASVDEPMDLGTSDDVLPDQRTTAFPKQAENALPERASPAELSLVSNQSSKTIDSSAPAVLSSREMDVVLLPVLRKATSVENIPHQPLEKSVSLTPVILSSHEMESVPLRNIEPASVPTAPVGVLTGQSQIPPVPVIIEETIKFSFGKHEPVICTKRTVVQAPITAENPDVISFCLNFLRQCGSLNGMELIIPEEQTGSDNGDVLPSSGAHAQELPQNLVKFANSASRNNGDDGTVNKADAEVLSSKENHNVPDLAISTDDLTVIVEKSSPDSEMPDLELEVLAPPAPPTSEDFAEYGAAHNADTLNNEKRSNITEAKQMKSASRQRSGASKMSTGIMPELHGDDEFAKLLNALLDKNATEKQLDDLDFQKESLFKKKETVSAAVKSLKYVSDSDEELSSGEDGDCNSGDIAQVVNEILATPHDANAASTEKTETERRENPDGRKRQAKKSQAAALLDSFFDDILKTAGDVEMESDGFSDSEESDDLKVEHPHLPCTQEWSEESLLGDEIELDSDVDELVNNAMKDVQEAEDAKKARLKAERKKVKDDAAVNGSVAENMEDGKSDTDSDEESGFDDSEKEEEEEESGKQTTVIPENNKKQPEIAAEENGMSDADIFAGLTELFGKDPAADEIKRREKSDKIRLSATKSKEDSVIVVHSRSNSPKKLVKTGTGSSPKKSVREPSVKEISTDEDKENSTSGESDDDFGAPVTRSPKKSSSGKNRSRLESDSDYEPDKDSDGGGGDIEMIDLSSEDSRCEEEDVTDSDTSVSNMPNFNSHVVKEKPLSQTSKKKRLPVRSKVKIISDKDLSKESRNALKAEQERKKRLEELPMYEGNILDEFVEEEIPYRVEVYERLWNKLEEHQKSGVKFMYRNVIESYKFSCEHPFGGCILAHSMGLGKTVQVISLMQAILSNKVLNLETCLVLCPASTIGNWENECVQWMKGIPKDLTIKAYTFTEYKTPVARLKLLKTWKSNGGLLMMSYMMFSTMCKAGAPLSEEFRKFLLEPGPDIVVCDEAHELRNSKSLKTKIITEIATTARIALTGTPLQNNLDEYWTMVNFIKPSLLGSRKEFQNRFSVPIKAGSRMDAEVQTKSVMKKRSHVLRETLSACLQLRGVSILTERLPAKTEHVIRVRLTAEQEALYRAYIKESGIANGYKGGQVLYCVKSVQLISFNPRCVKKDLDNEIRKAKKGFEQRKHRASRQQDGDGAESDSDVSDVEGQNAAAPLKFWFDNLLPSADELDVTLGSKTLILREIIVQCLINEEKLLIFSDRKVVLAVVEELLEKIHCEKLLTLNGREIQMLRGVNYLALDGSVPQEKRQGLINKFNSNRNCSIFLLSIKAAGQGINLTGANRVVLLEPMWNPTVDRQALFRTYRYGQTKPVHVYRLVTAGICEEKIFEIQVDKQSMFNRVLEEKHAKPLNCLGEDFFTYREHPFETAFVPPLPPNDKVMQILLEKFTKEIVRTENFDSLLEPVEPCLSFEEQLVAWAEFEIEERGPTDILRTAAIDRERAVNEINKQNVAPFELVVNDIASVKHLVSSLTRNLWKKNKNKENENGGDVFIKIYRPIIEKVSEIVERQMHLEREAYMQNNAQAYSNMSANPYYHPRPPAPGTTGPNFHGSVRDIHAYYGINEGASTSQGVTSNRPNHPAVSFKRPPAPARNPGNSVNDISNNVQRRAQLIAPQPVVPGMPIPDRRPPPYTNIQPAGQQNVRPPAGLPPAPPLRLPPL